MDLPSSTKIVLLGLVAAWIWKKYSAVQKHLPYPPGPKGYPLIGNVFDMPTEYAWISVYEMKKKYGDLIFMQVIGKPILFVNSYSIASALLDRRSLTYSSRPKSIMAEDLLKWDWFLPVMPYGEKWKKNRQQLHPFLDLSAINNYIERQTRDSHVLLKELLSSPEDFYTHIRKGVGSTIMKIVYGHEVESFDDPYIQLVEEAIDYVGHATRPGAFMVEIFPWLRYVPEWVPGAKFQKFAREGREKSLAMRFKPFYDVKKKVMNGVAEPCILSEMIEANRRDDDTIQDEELCANVAGVLYAAGADTSVSVLQTFFLAMVLYPEAQRRAQEELDRVIGRTRLPTLDDKPNLPYINATILESLRFYPVGPFAIPRLLEKDDEYEGYTIPKGTIVTPNVWGICHDADEFPDPFAFKPDRFLPDSGKKMPLNPTKVVFGFGRRMCPGRDMALNSIFLYISAVLSVFDIKPASDEYGKPIIPNVEYYSNMITFPKPFKCSITPRTPECVNLINQL